MKWIDGVLREKIGYRGLVVSDDLDMGGVLNGSSIEDAAVGTLEAGSDMFLVCQKEEHVWRAFEAVFRRAEIDRKFAGLVVAKAKRVAAFQSKSSELKARMAPAPRAKTVDTLRRRVWEFSEELRLRSAPCDCCGSDERDVGGRDRRGASARAGARVSFASGVAGTLSLCVSGGRSPCSVAGNECASGESGRLGAVELHAGRIVCEGCVSGTTAGEAGVRIGGMPWTNAVSPERGGCVSGQ